MTIQINTLLALSFSFKKIWASKSSDSFLLVLLGKTVDCFFFLHFPIAPLISKQIDTDDVITLEEQVYIISGARAKCDISIKAQLSLLEGLCDLCADAVLFDDMVWRNTLNSCLTAFS